MAIADSNFADFNFADHNFADCKRIASASVASKLNFVYSVMIYMKCVGFSKGGQKWPQICSTRLGFRDTGL